MKIKWADGVDYVTVCEERKHATISMGGVSIAASENHLSVKHNGICISAYAPAGMPFTAMVAAVQWVFDHINILPHYGMFREYDPDGIETADAPMEVS